MIGTGITNGSKQGRHAGAQESPGLRTKEHLQGKGTVAGVPRAALDQGGTFLGHTHLHPHIQSLSSQEAALHPAPGFSASCFLHEEEDALLWGERSYLSKLKEAQSPGPGWAGPRALSPYDGRWPEKQPGAQGTEGVSLSSLPFNMKTSFQLQMRDRQGRRES